MPGAEPGAELDGRAFVKTAAVTAAAVLTAVSAGISGRQVPGQPLPDHGKQEYDLNFHGGNFAAPHPQYYKETA